MTCAANRGATAGPATVQTTCLAPRCRESSAPSAGQASCLASPGGGLIFTIGRSRRDTYLELAAARRCKLVPARLQAVTRLASPHRWMSMLATVAQRALAHTLLARPFSGGDACSCASPPLGDLLTGSHSTRCQTTHRLVLRAGQLCSYAGALVLSLALALICGAIGNVC